MYIVPLGKVRSMIAIAEQCNSIGEMYFPVEPTLQKSTKVATINVLASFRVMSPNVFLGSRPQEWGFASGVKSTVAKAAPFHSSSRLRVLSAMLSKLNI